MKQAFEGHSQQNTNFCIICVTHYNKIKLQIQAELEIKIRTFTKV